MPSTITRSPGARPEETSHWSPMARSRLSIRCSTLPPASTINATGFPFGSRDDRLLGNQDGLVVDAFFNHRPDEHARQENAIRIGKDRPQNHGAGRRIHRDVAKLQRPFQRIRGAVLQDELHLVLVRPVVVDPPFLQAALQSQQRRWWIAARPRKWDPVAESSPGPWADTPSRWRRPSRWTCRCDRRSARRRGCSPG